MRTTLKRGISRGAAFDGNGQADLPAVIVSPVTRYVQPERRRGRFRLLGRILFGLVAALAMAIGALGGGVYLFFHHSVGAVQDLTAPEKIAREQLNIPEPGKPAIAIIIGYDHRFVEGKLPSRSDTVMLIRAQPDPKAISLLSFPRDLQVPIICPGKPSPGPMKLNQAYFLCGPKGTIATVKNLTGLDINYFITVNFRGFKQVVDALGGVWIDVDHRYYNQNLHTADTNYASIDLQPGYQRLNGQQALDYVRYRHSDSDLYRNARQQLFVRSVKEQARHAFSALKVPRLVGAVTRNVHIGQGGGKDVSEKTIWSYALLAYGMPSGHFFQPRLQTVTQIGGTSDLGYSEDELRSAVNEFVNPDVEAPAKATAAALGRRYRGRHGPSPRSVSVLVLNGSGVEGSATQLSYLLSQRGYKTLLPANGALANAPTQNYFHSAVYFDPRKKDGEAAAKQLSKLIGSTDVHRGIPAAMRPLAGRAMEVVVTGQTFHEQLAPSAPDQTPPRKRPAIRQDPGATLSLLKGAQKKVDFPVMVPHRLEKSSQLSTTEAMRVYRMAKHDAIRLVFNGPTIFDYWGIEETNWDDAPVLDSPTSSRTIKGRRYDLYFAGPHLHMVVLRGKDHATYWVVNTLLDSLSNETMLSIAKGLQPLRGR